MLGARDPRRANARTWLILLACLAVVFLVVPALRFGVWALVL